MLSIIFGPTGSGKTSLAFDLAKQQNALLISVDSRKAYKQLNIGTHKTPLLDFQKRTGQKIYGIDMFDITEVVTAAEFRQRLSGQINEDKSMSENIVIFGGTGLYIDSLLYWLPLGVASGTEQRDKLNKLSLAELQAIIQEKDPTLLAAMNESDRNNPRRLIRVLEKFGQIKNTDTIIPNNNLLFDYIKNSEVTMYLPSLDRDELYQNINTRVASFFAEGWMSEVEQLLKNNEPDEPGLSILGYKQICEWLENQKVSEQVLVEHIQRLNRNYAKRQLTWMQRYSKDIELVYPDRLLTPKMKIQTYP